LDANELAEWLGVSVARINQLRREGGLKIGPDNLYSAADALRSHYWYDSPRGEALRARTRMVSARALETEMRSRRQMRRLLTLDEVGEICAQLYTGARDVAQAESSRFFTRYRETHSETDSLGMTHQLYDPILALGAGWINGVNALMRAIDEDHLPENARLDEVLQNLVAEVAAANNADETSRRAAGTHAGA